MELVLQYAVPALLSIGVIGAVIIKTRKVLVEISEVLVKVDEALSDNNVSKDEIQQIIKEAKDVWTAVKAFGKK